MESCELLTQKSRILDRLQTSRVDPCNQASGLPTLPAADGKWTCQQSLHFLHRY